LHSTCSSIHHLAGWLIPSVAVFFYVSYMIVSRAKSDMNLQAELSATTSVRIGENRIGFEDEERDLKTLGEGVER